MESGVTAKKRKRRKKQGQQGLFLLASFATYCGCFVLNRARSEHQSFWRPRESVISLLLLPREVICLLLSLVGQVNDLPALQPCPGMRGSYGRSPAALRPVTLPYKNDLPDIGAVSLWLTAHSSQL
jgi:hypothetical protein